MNTKREIAGSYHDYLIKSLQDPKELAAYLHVTMEEFDETGDITSLLISLRHIVEAKGGIAKLADQTKLNKQTLYRTLSLEGNPRFHTLTRILKALGVKMSFKVSDSENKAA